MSESGLIDKLITRHARENPHDMALLGLGERYTFAQLEKVSAAYGAKLREAGVGPGVVVGLHLARCPRTVVGLLAILKAGAAYLPLEPNLPLERRRLMAQDANAALLLTLKKEPEDLGLPIPMLYLDQPPEAQSLAPKEAPQRLRQADDIAYITYTSGSTGKPKGVPMPHGSLCNALSWLQGRAAYRPGDRALYKSPLGFDVSSRWEILWPLACGATVVVAKSGGELDAAYIRRTIRAAEISVMHFVPSMLDALLEGAEPGSKTLRRVFSGGEALSYDLKSRFFEAFPHCELVDIYGATETIVATYRICKKDDPPHSRPVAWPIERLPLYLLDEGGEPVEDGEPGEIYVGGDFLAAGYLSNASLTQARFLPAGDFAQKRSLTPGSAKGGDGVDDRARVFRTGDWARRLKSGALEHLGRRDNQIKIGGVRIELSEIESVLAQVPGLERGVVLPFTAANGSRQLAAFLKWHGQDGSSKPLSPQELRGNLRLRLPIVMVPSRFIQVTEFPLNANGKLDRIHLLKRLNKASEGGAAPTTSAEKWVAKTWSKLLKVNGVGIEDEFFALGGDSLSAMQLLVQIRQAYPLELSLERVMQGVTLGQLAAWIEAGRMPEAQMPGMSAAELDAQVEGARLRLPMPTAQGPSNPASDILLTGATGFLGVFLLDELLRQTEAKILCLIRGDREEAKEKLAKTARRYGLAFAPFAQRIEIIPGDFSAAYLGLDKADYHKLGQRLGAIYHAGAQVNEALDYAALYGANVSGTQRLLHLAALRSDTAFHFISSTAIFESSHYLRAQEIDDGSPRRAIGRLYGGYAQSKWVAEGLVEAAQELGMATTIFRPGSIAGHSQRGHMAEDQFLARLLRGALDLGGLPASPIRLTLTPVDYVSRAIVGLSQDPIHHGQAFNLVNAPGISMAALADRARDLGYAIAPVDLDDWVEQAAQHVATRRDHALTTVLPLFMARIPGHGEPAFYWNELTARVRGNALTLLNRKLHPDNPYEIPSTTDLLSLYLKRLSRRNSEAPLESERRRVCE